MAPPVFKTELRGVTLRGWFDSIPSPPAIFSVAESPLTLSPSTWLRTGLSHKGRGNLTLNRLD